MKNHLWVLLLSLKRKAKLFSLCETDDQKIIKFQERTQRNEFSFGQTQEKIKLTNNFFSVCIKMNLIFVL